jgi:hypothetical protein
MKAKKTIMQTILEREILYCLAHDDNAWGDPKGKPWDIDFPLVINRLGCYRKETRRLLISNDDQEFLTHYCGLELLHVDSYELEHSDVTKDVLTIPVEVSMYNTKFMNSESLAATLVYKYLRCGSAWVNLAVELTDLTAIRGEVAFYQSGNWISI